MKNDQNTQLAEIDDFIKKEAIGLIPLHYNQIVKKSRNENQRLLGIEKYISVDIYQTTKFRIRKRYYKSLIKVVS